MLNDCINN